MAPSAISPEPAVPASSTNALSSVTTSFDDTLRFYLNGTKVVIDNIDPEVTLLEYLRGIGLTGTKLGCAEGGCGACTVVISQYNPTTKKIYHASVNACLAPLVSVDGKHVITIEGIGNTKRPHPTQERIARGNGSQCGFCTPGQSTQRFHLSSKYYASVYNSIVMKNMSKLKTERKRYEFEAPRKNATQPLVLLTY